MQPCFDLINIHEQHISSNCSHLTIHVVIYKQCTRAGRVNFSGHHTSYNA